VHETDACANCLQPVAVAEQKFCPACGESTPAHRIDWHFIAHELEHSVLHMDRGILYTLKCLMLQPGELIRDYVEGRRRGIVKPLLLIMMMAALVAVLTRYVVGHDVMDASLLAGAADGVRAGGNPGVARIAAIYTSVNQWMNLHFAASTLILIPVEAAMFRLSFGRLGGLNYPEWLVITAFLTVQTFVLWVLSVPLHRSYPATMIWVVLAAMSYAIFTLIRFFKDQPWWKVTLRTLIGFGLFIVAQWIAMLMVVLWVLASS